MANAVLLLFAAGMLLCLCFDWSIFFALAFGSILFAAYAKRGRSLREVIAMMLRGVWNIKILFLYFLLIGMMTGLWRSSGTIPAIIAYASRLITPQLFLPTAFLLNCGVSLLIGTSFGTATTMGVICMSLGRSLGLSPALLGGAILAGAFFGDRCSPMSSSAYLVATVTGTELRENIRGMMHTALVPFCVSLLLYTLAGFLFPAAGAAESVAELFDRSFAIRPVVILPAAVLLLLVLLRMDVKLAMLVSIVAAFVLAVTVQHAEVQELLRVSVLGYAAEETDIAALLNGGGIISMGRAFLIVGISSTYAEIFRRTDLLCGCKKLLQRLSVRLTPFGACAAAGCGLVMITCNQSSPIIILHQLLDEILPDAREQALTFEDTVIVLAPLVPWSIAGAVPLAAVGAPTAALLAAWYLYLLPLWSWLAALRKARKKK